MLDLICIYTRIEKLVERVKNIYLYIYFLQIRFFNYKIVILCFDKMQNVKILNYNSLHKFIFLLRSFIFNLNFFFISSTVISAIIQRSEYSNKMTLCISKYVISRVSLFASMRIE